MGGAQQRAEQLYPKRWSETLDAIARAPHGQKHGQVLRPAHQAHSRICKPPRLALKEGGIRRGFQRRSPSCSGWKQNR